MMNTKTKANLFSMKPETAANSRVRWINIFKGIGILLVIFEHCLLSAESIVAKTILMFHMPLFFYISGYCFNPDMSEAEARWWRIKNIKQTSVLYILFSIIGFAWNVLRGYLNHTVSSREAGISFLKLLYGNQVNGKLVGGGCWFLLTLLMCKIIFSLIWQLARKKKEISPIAFFTVIVIFYVAACASNITSIEMLPFCLDNVRFAMIFYALGCFVRQYSRLLAPVHNIGISSVLAVISFGILCACAYFNNTAVMMHANEYGSYLLFIVGALAGIFFIGILSIGLDRFGAAAKLFEYFGKDTTYYFLMQFIVIDVVKAVFRSRLEEAPLTAVVIFIIVVLILIPVNKMAHWLITPAINKIAAVKK